MMGLVFVVFNCNKWFVVIDLKLDEGKEIFCDFIKIGDIFIYNMCFFFIFWLGFVYDDVVKIKFDIVYVEVMGYDFDGFYVGW